MTTQTELLETLLQTAHTAKAIAESALVLAEQLKAENTKQYVNLADAVSILGSGFSVSTLQAKCRDGSFKHGKHFINTSNGEKPNYLVNPNEVRKYFETPPERRFFRVAG